jgi:hypothetical protein
LKSGRASARHAGRFLRRRHVGTVALDAHNKFLRINKISDAISDPHLMCWPLRPRRRGCCRLISNTGETKDILKRRTSSPRPVHDRQHHALRPQPAQRPGGHPLLLLGSEP